MSIETSELKQPTKGEQIRALVMAKLSPVARDRMEVQIVKDSANLTKVRISYKLSERANGGAADEL